jgi:hypothetical protein
VIRGRKVTGSFASFPAKAGKDKDSLTAEDVQNEYFAVRLFLFAKIEGSRRLKRKMVGTAHPTRLHGLAGSIVHD